MTVVSDGDRGGPHDVPSAVDRSAVERVPPVHGKIDVVCHDGSGLFAELPSPLAATRYHSLAVTDPQPPLIANAWSADLPQQCRHILFNNVPHNRWFNQVVSVAEDVSEVDNAAVLGDSLCERRR